jgi:hypothetical protein
MFAFMIRLLLVACWICRLSLSEGVMTRFPQQRGRGFMGRRGGGRPSSLESHNPEGFSFCSSPVAKSRSSVLPASNPSWII